MTARRTNETFVAVNGLENIWLNSYSYKTRSFWHQKFIRSLFSKEITNRKIKCL